MGKFTYRVLILIFATAGPSYALLPSSQPTYVDSVRTLFQQGKVYKDYENWERTLPYFQKMTQIAEAHQDTSYIVRCNVQLSYIYLELEMYDSVLAQMEYLMPMAEAAHDSVSYWRAQTIYSGALAQASKEEALLEIERGKLNARKAGSMGTIADAFNNEYLYLMEIGELQKALSASDSASYYYNLANNPKRVAIGALNRGNILRELGQYETALASLHEALSIAEQDSLLFTAALIYNGIGELYWQLENAASAQEYYHLGLKWAPDSSRIQALIYSGLGTTYFENQQYDSARLFYHKSLVLWQFKEYHTNILLQLCNLIALEFELNEGLEGVPILMAQADALLPKVDHKIQVAMYQLIKGEYFLRNKEATRALEVLAMAEPIIFGEGYLKGAVDLRYLQREAYLELQDWATYREYQLEYEQLRDSLRNTERDQFTQKLNVEYGLTRRDREITNLRQENELQADLNAVVTQKLELQKKNLNLSLVVLATIIVFLGVVSWAYRRIRAKNQIIQKLNAEINHRTLNHLSFIQKFYSLEARSATDADQRKAMESGVVKLESMLALYRQLYNDLDDQKRVPLLPYLTGLLEKLMEVSGLPEDSVMVGGPEILIDVEEMKQVGLILTELATNSIKYGQTTGTPFQLKVTWSLPNAKKLEIVLADNGPGLSDSVAMMRQKSFGLNVLFMLAEKQLKGELTYAEEDGAQWKLSWNPKILEHAILS